MAIVENFYNGDMARPIREIITQNFANVSKYIPNNFISLTTMERQNLSDDYKTHFKLVFDKEQEYVYRWSEVERNWKQYLIRAKDEYARAEVDTNTERAFANAEIGTPNPYTITFYNRKGTAKDSIFLTSANIQYDDEYSTQGIIDKIISDFNSLNNFVGDRDIFLNNQDITSKTITGALNEINQKTIDNKTEIDKILDGTTTVPNANHANEADHAINADLAEDSNKLGGQLPSYYATQSGLDSTNESLTNTISRVEKNESDIAELQDGLNNTNQDLSDLKDRVDTHDKQIDGIYDVQETHAIDIDTIFNQLDEMDSQIGWEILDGEYKNWVNGFKKDKDYAQYQFKTSFEENSFDDFIRAKNRIINSVNYDPNQGFIKFGNSYYITFSISKTQKKDSFSVILKEPSTQITLCKAEANKDSSGYVESSKTVTGTDTEITLPSSLPTCSYISPEARWFNERMLLLAPEE